jgi:hypothetical protein
MDPDAKLEEKAEMVYKKPAQVVDKAAKSEKGRMLGAWAFIIGMVIAVVLALATAWLGWGVNEAGALSLILVILGLVVGLVNISEAESTQFLLAALVLVVLPVGFGQLDMIPAVGAGGIGIGAILSIVVHYISIFVAPAALVVALKAMYSAAREP